MLRAAIAETLRPGVYSADSEGVVGMRLEGIAFDMRLIKFDARQMRQMPELRAILLERKLLWYPLHPTSSSVLTICSA